MGKKGREIVGVNVKELIDDLNAGTRPRWTLGDVKQTTKPRFCKGWTT